MEKIEMLKRRLMAGFIDCVLFGSVALILHIPVRILGLPEPIPSLFSFMIMLFFGFLLLAKDGPTWFIEALRGQSPGKKAIGLLVTKLDGRTNISWGDSINRNLPLAVPYLIAAMIQVLKNLPIIGGFLIWMAMLGFLVSALVIGIELIMMFKDPEGRRWGDHRACTKVTID